MKPQVKVTMDERFAQALLDCGRIVIRVVEPGTPATGAARTRREPQPGSHLEKLLAWGREHGQPFQTPRVAKLLGISVRHASVLLVTAVQGDLGVRRLSHGVYLVDDR
ncbi:MAG: hypothetical protein AAGD14_16070 [Planctomycetota bacterium]